MHWDGTTWRKLEYEQQAGGLPKQGSVNSTNNPATWSEEGIYRLDTSVAAFTINFDTTLNLLQYRFIFTVQNTNNVVTLKPAIGQRFQGLAIDQTIDLEQNTNKIYMVTANPDGLIFKDLDGTGASGGVLQTSHYVNYHSNNPANEVVP